MTSHDRSSRQHKPKFLPVTTGCLGLALGDLTLCLTLSVLVATANASISVVRLDTRYG